MTPISKAISEIKFSIPRDVLNKVFVNASAYYRSGTSIEQQIEYKVIRPRVLVDCNIAGGQQVAINLSGLPKERAGDQTNVGTIVHIPKTRTEGKSIISVLSVVFVNSAIAAGYMGMAQPGMASMTSLDSTALSSAAAGLMSSADRIPWTETSRVELIAENTIIVRDNLMLPDNCSARCILENDENLSNISLRMYPLFSQLVTEAVKAYIYNETIVELDKGQLYYGQDLGVIKDIISGYSDANQNYLDLLAKKWTRAAAWNDPVTRTRFMNLVSGSNN